MLTEVKNNYKSILKHFDFDESISSVAYKKQKLIEMAKRGEAKPNWKTKLGSALGSYTGKSSQIFDLKFTITLKNIRPDWLIKKPTADYKKHKLINMAKRGEPKPSQKTKLGKALARYINKGPSYCPSFDKIIRKLRPDWFVSQSQIANKKKQKLIYMAKSGAKKPSRRSKEGQSLASYTNKPSSCYCPIFDKNIRKLRPDWFTSTSKIANKKKQKLIDIAKSGSKRPNQKTKEGRALSRYTNKPSSCYCPIFDKTIRRLRPDWFIKSSDLMKQKLIYIAKSGAKRPHRKTKEGVSLSIYILKSSAVYCPKFDKTIRKLRPDWFILHTPTDQVRQKLINMAKNGDARPSQKTKLGTALRNYIGKTHNSYCEKFDKLIRKLAPNWFIIKPRQYK